ncbi:MAG: hypothetical protein CSB24_02725 [Deltaproteobacteria bacterium]|nr:MAG: hypothetical protein CSB24_02725 [Deltaproteobacteria bacterium]
MIDQPVSRIERGISPIWILPVIALVICGWLLFQSYQNKGVDIIIYFDDASGITPGKTQVVAMGMPIGMVKEVSVDLGHNRIKTLVKMERKAADILVEDTAFWVVRPEISAAKIYGLDTIITGSYVGVQAGSSQKRAAVFQGLSSPPPVRDDTPGLHFFLRAESLHSIQAGSGIYYKNIHIGSVRTYSLEEGGEGEPAILINCHVSKDYAHLVKPESIFSNASGISISGKLTSPKFRMTSLASLLTGGIQMDNPEASINSNQVEKGHIFKLYKDRKSADYTMPMTLELASGSGIAEGVTKVIYQGMEAGLVERVDFTDDQQTITAHILLGSQAGPVLKEGTRFWLVQPSIGADGVKNLETALSGAFITFQPGGGEYCNHFKILPEPPPLKPLRSGRAYTLNNSGSAKLSIGSPVLFKNIKVGKVIDITINPENGQLKSTIFIFADYLPLVSASSVFWHQGGLRVDAGLAGVNIETGTLSSFISGGVAFFTPDMKKGKVPEAGYSFKLYESYGEAAAGDSSLKAAGFRFKLTASEIGSVAVGSPILYQKVRIGRVENLRLDKEQIIMDCVIEPKYQEDIRSNSRFYNLSGVEVNGGLSGLSVKIGSLSTIISGGIGLYNPKQQGTALKRKKIFTVYKSLQEAKDQDYLPIKIDFAKAPGIKIGTPLKFGGLDVGRITELDIEHLPAITATVRVKPSVEKYFRTGTRVWLESSEINLMQIKNPGAAIFGPYITFRPGGGKPAAHFTALIQPPVPKIVRETDGLNLVLESKNLGSLGVNSPIYYRQVQIGKVIGYELDEAFQKVLIYIHIEPRFSPIIRKNTKFWNASGVKIEGGVFSGLSLKTESLKSIIGGGIALATPEEKSGGQVKDGSRFVLHDECDEKWLDWNPDILVLEKEPLPVKGK